MITRAGLRLDERYLLTERIAVGGMGEVWKAMDGVLDREVAVKILRNDLSSGDPFRQRFRTEARTAAMLSHPCIAAVFDYGEVEDTAYLVMELVPGSPLSEIISRQGAIGIDKALDYLSQVARALHAAHQRGVVHRDVKPANIMITPSGRATITDFGIARMRHHESLTATGQVMGTAHYLAPEVARGETATPQSDLYALGVVGYECLAGWRPFDGKNQIAVATAHLREQAPPLPETIPEEIRSVIFQALEKNPTVRPESCEAFASLLEGLLRGRRGTGAPMSMIESTMAAALTSGRPSAFRPSAGIPGAAAAQRGTTTGAGTPAPPAGAGTAPGAPPARHGRGQHGSRARRGSVPAPAGHSPDGTPPAGRSPGGTQSSRRSSGGAPPAAPTPGTGRTRVPRSADPQTTQMPLGTDGAPTFRRRADARRSAKPTSPLLAAVARVPERWRLPALVVLAVLVLLLLATALIRSATGPGTGDISPMAPPTPMPGVRALTAPTRTDDGPTERPSHRASRDGDGSAADVVRTRVREITVTRTPTVQEFTGTSDDGDVTTRPPDQGRVEVRTEAYQGQTAADVRRILQDRGMTVRSRSQKSDQPEGTVVRVHPTGMLKRGATVTVVVSDGG